MAGKNKPGISAVSLEDPETICRIMRRMDHHPKVRQCIFREVARNAKLQEELLAILGKYSAAQTDFFVELTKRQKLRRLIFGIAAERV